jgi:hypothetical protein
LGGEAPSHRVHIGVVREVAVLTETHVDDPPEDGSEVENSVARRWRSLRRALRTEEQRIVDDLVEDAERASAGRPIVTVVDDAFELVAERVLHVGAVGSFVHWSLDDQAEGYERHVLARQP